MHIYSDVQLSSQQVLYPEVDDNKWKLQNNERIHGARWGSIFRLAPYDILMGLGSLLPFYFIYYHAIPCDLKSSGTKNMIDSCFYSMIRLIMIGCRLVLLIRYHCCFRA